MGAVLCLRGERTKLTLNKVVVIHESSLTRGTAQSRVRSVCHPR